MATASVVFMVLSFGLAFIGIICQPNPSKESKVNSRKEAFYRVWSWERKVRICWTAAYILILIGFLCLGFAWTDCSTKI